MTLEQLFALLPFIVLAGVICVLLLAIAFWRNFTASAAISVVGLALTLASILWVARVAPVQVTPLMIVDVYGLLYAFLVTATALGIALLAFDYFREREGLQDEFYVLLLSSTLGAMTLTCATHFASFVLGLELLGVSLYAMISYPRRGMKSLEAALKYLILSGVSSAFILFGTALVFAVTGTLAFAELAGATVADDSSLILIAGVGMMLAGIMFKLSLVPFHMWTPDVYEGAPAPVTAFVATVSKGAIFAVLLRLFVLAELANYAAVLSAIAVVAILSMLIGNLLALLQDNVKRILAYSSIAQLGYLLVALAAIGQSGGPSLSVESCTYFVLAYLVTTLGAFGVVTIMSIGDADNDADDIAQYEGMFWQRPALATFFSAMLLSLAGIPLTIGFIGKFYLFVAGVSAALWPLVGALIVGSGIGLYYYLRIIFTMTRRVESGQRAVAIPAAGGCVMVSLVVVLVVFGVYPTPVVDLITQMVGAFL